jgi:tetratricopeptide (TPR) repeat protein
VLDAEARGLSWYINFLGYSGRFDEALAHTARAIELYGALGNRFEQALMMAIGGRCWGSRAGRLGDAFAYAARASEIARELDDSRLKAWGAMVAEPYYYKGSWRELVAEAERSLPIAWEIGEHNVIVYVSAWLGLAHLRLGHRDEARRLISRCLGWAESRLAGVPFAVSYASTARALVHLTDGELSEALERARIGLSLGERSRSPLEQGVAWRAIAQIHEAKGDDEDADAAYRHSLDLLEPVKALPEVGQSLLAYGRFKLAHQPAEGRRLVGRAREIFADIGATGWVSEAEGALTGG